MTTYPDKLNFLNVHREFLKHGYSNRLEYTDKYIFSICDNLRDIFFGFCTSNLVTYSSLDGKISVCSVKKQWNSGVIILPIPTNKHQMNFILKQIPILRRNIYEYKSIKDYDYGFI